MTWLSGYKNRLKLTIDHTKVDATLTNFPLMVKLSASSGATTKNVSNIFDSLGSYNNRKKITVRLEDNTECYVEIQSWDHANKIAHLWVRVPSISSTVDTILYLYYDKNRVDNTIYIGDTGSTPAKTVWDSNYKIVTHLEQDPSGTAPQILDSTSNGFNGTSAGTMTTSDLVSAKIHNGLDLDGSNDYIGFSDAFYSDTLTIEAIIKPDVVNVNGKSIITKRNSTGITDSGTPEWSFVINANGTFALVCYTSGAVACLNINSATALVAGTTYHIIVVASGNGSTGYVYLNGNQNNSASQTAAILNTTNLIQIGCRTGNTDTRYFDGIIEEVRISNTARSASYVKASYNSAWDTLVTYSAQFVGGQYVTNDIFDVFKTQYIRNSIANQTFTQTIRNLLGDGLNQYVKTPHTPHYTHYIRNTLSGHFNKTQFIRNSISEGFNKTQYIKNRLETFSVLTQQYIRNSLADREVIRPAHDFDVLIDGVSVKGYINEVKIGINESTSSNINNPFNDIEIFFINLSEFHRCDVSNNRGTERIVVTIDSVVYKFLLEDRLKSEKFEDSKFTIWGRQITAKLGEGLAPASTITYQNKMASFIAGELAGDIPVSWIATDYFIPDFSFEGLPIDGLKLLASGVGAIVRTKPDGSLLIRKKFPIRPKDLVDVSCEHNLSRDNILKLDYSEVQASFNAITVELGRGTEEAVYDFEIETECYKKGTAAIIKVYSSKPSVDYEVCATQSNTTKLEANVSETLTETIIIKDGKGSVTKPIFDISSYSSEKCSGEGELIDYKAGSKDIMINGVKSAIATISYTTKFDRWQVLCLKKSKVLIPAIITANKVQTINVITGKGDREADSLIHPFILTETQAVEAGKAFIDDNFYRKHIYRLEIPYMEIIDGQIASIADDINNAYGKGIVRASDITISLNKDAHMINQIIEIHTYSVDERL